MADDHTNYKTGDGDGDEGGGILWKTLSMEEDILTKVLNMMDPSSLNSLELACKAFRHYIKRKHLWQKSFMRIDFYAFEYGTRRQILHELNNQTPSSQVHVKYKRICLSLEQLLRNELCLCSLCTNKGSYFPKCLRYYINI